jgi:DNA polymerase-3 subunit beta
MRLIEGEFPNYDQVIPKELTRRIALPCDTLIQALRRVVLLSSERSRAVKLEISEGNLAISSNNPDLGDAHEDIDIDFSGDTLSIGFNARYLLDALGSMHAKEIFLGLQDELSPVKILPTDDEDSFAVVMPMRI